MNHLDMQGRYEILSLSGSYLPTDLGGGARQRTGGLSVSLAGSDGRVIGGGVAGMLTAASPIQVSDMFLFKILRLEREEIDLGTAPFCYLLSRKFLQFDRVQRSCNYFWNHPRLHIFSRTFPSL